MSMSVAVLPASRYTHHMYLPVPPDSYIQALWRPYELTTNGSIGPQRPALRNGEMARGEDPAERGTVVRGHPTRSDHHRGH